MELLVEFPVEQFEVFPMHLPEKLAGTLRENLDRTPRVIPGELLKECTIKLKKVTPRGITCAAPTGTPL